MKDSDFWTLIDEAKPQSHIFSTEEHFASCKERLESLSDKNLVDFQVQVNKRFRRAYKWDLWAAAFIINSGCSDDQFIDFIHGLIFQGLQAYENAVKNADSIANLENARALIEYELVAALPYEIFTERNGSDDIDFFDLVEEIYDPGSLDAPKGRAWKDEEALKSRLPLLSRRFTDSLPSDK